MYKRKKPLEIPKLNQHRLLAWICPNPSCRGEFQPGRSLTSGESINCKCCGIPHERREYTLSPANFPQSLWGSYDKVR